MQRGWIACGESVGKAGVDCLLVRVARVIVSWGNRKLGYLQGTILIGGLLENLRRNPLRGVPRVAQKKKEKKKKDFAFSVEICSFSLRFFFILLLFCVDAYALCTA